MVQRTPGDAAGRGRVRATLLVVDDEPANLSLLDAVLRPHFRVRAARSGLAALRAASSEPVPDLILLDVMMPGLDGHEVLRRLRAEPATREIPVLFVTALGDDADQERGLELGAADYLTKPIRPRVLLARVRTQLEARQARLMLNRLNQQLEQKVEQDADALERAHAQLMQAQRIDAVGTLASGIAHDFNNLLGAMLGYAAMAEEDLRLGRPVAEHLAQVRQAGQRARMLVQRILAFGRREPVELKAQSLQPLLQETVALLRATLPAGVTLAWRAAPDPWPVRADATQVQQVLLNLGINAAQAVPHAQGRIEIGLDFVTLAQDATLPPDLAPGRYARLWVSDDGCGMDEATRARAFEPFFTTKPAGQGTGLGLFAVQDIARRHGGAVTLASAVGQGTTVRLMLPVADDRPAPVVAEGRPQPEARGDALSSQGLRVLYVDDDETVAALAERLLRRAGCVPVIHTDAERALQALRADTGAVDAVVTDHHMPRMSGLELAAAVRSAAPQLPVLLGSGHVDAALQAACARAGVHELLRKERLAEQLVPAVVRAVAAARRGGSPPDAA